jgi:hypothetical protein
MFVIGDESKINGSDLNEPSIVGGGVAFDGLPVGRSQSILTDHALDRNRYLYENFEFIDFTSIGSLSNSMKLKGRTTGTYYLLKCVRKLKYGKQ